MAADDLLRKARLATPSPSDSGRPMTRTELAEAVNAWIFDKTGKHYVIDGNYVAKLERDVIRRPQMLYRAALRAVLGAESDAELGLVEADLYREQPSAKSGLTDRLRAKDKADAEAAQKSAAQDANPTTTSGGPVTATVRVIVAPGTSVLVSCVDPMGSGVDNPQPPTSV